ncbi:carbonic anhydrase [Uliginosibacterium gangwonense]|uniref:carbonic anhydrase n=1 Tax=Uliginosibacterium gangwonense TaxID=392736 RepID=UPI00035F6F3D|nr:carbonic anhydrase family protein [Uliginosibacterium gangwonense]
MRGLKIALVVWLAGCLLPLAQGADWLVVAKDKLRSVELDRSSIIDSDAGSKVAWGRIVISDAHAELTGYKTLRVLNRYDCSNRSFTVIKRLYLSRDDNVLREEALEQQKASVVRPGTVDERFYTEVCPAPAPVIVSKPGSKAASVADLRNLAAEAARRAEQVRKGNGDDPRPFRRADVQLVKAESDSDTPLNKPVDRKDAGGSVKPGSGYAALPVSIRQAQAQMLPALRGTVPAGHKTPAAAGAHVEGGHGAWSYEGATGPQAWGSIQPDYAACAKGTRQSPIDIRDGIKVDQEAIVFDYKPARFSIMDNGHSIQINYGEGSQLSVMGRSYVLQQFHFHLPSEEWVEGHGFAMSIHLVHKDPFGHLAVLALLVERGSANALVQTLWNNLPLERNEAYSPAVQINVQDLLPTRREYYSYMGSLTTPPCSEGVLWLVLKQPVQLSDEQLAVFSRFYRNNARPVQSANDRVIKESR